MWSGKQNHDAFKMADLEAKVEALAVSDGKPAAPEKKKDKKGAAAGADGAPLEVRCPESTGTVAELLTEFDAST